MDVIVPSASSFSVGRNIITYTINARRKKTHVSVCFHRSKVVRRNIKTEINNNCANLKIDIMNLSSVSCIFMTMFVLVQCKHGHHIKKHNDKTMFKMTQKKHNDYTLSEEVDCEMHRSGIIQTINHTTCDSYDRLVPLKPMPSQEFRPSVVSVKRCDGDCRRTACMPLRTRMIKVPVKSDNMCVLVEVEEHIDCKCMCLQKKEDCTDKQYYNKVYCACICKDQDTKKRECEEGTMKVWDDTDCTCNCTQMNMECTSGLNWNHDTCTCN